MKKVSLKIASEIRVVLGLNGSGKSTMLKVVAGILKGDEGTIHVNGKDIAGFSPEDRHVGYVPQQSSLFRHMNVRDNIRYCLRNKRGAEANIGKLIEMLGLEDVLDKKPDALSGGFQSRVALARTLASQPHVMLMDEPLSDLDLAIKEKLLPEFKRVLKTLGVPVIYVTHDLTEANLLGDRFSCMIEGVLTDADSAETAFGLIKESVLSKDLRK
ncbi:MAG: ATP-binding cassette domain-containing protein [Syntrophales bacterium]